jgi:hypothetical protein
MKKNYFLIMIVLVFFSCQKQVLTDASKVSTDAANKKPSSRVDVYVAGNLPNEIDYIIPTYWKNGHPVSLGFGHASSIAVVGSDVYVAGWSSLGGATYWKNGQAVSLRDNAEVTSIVVVKR